MIFILTTTVNVTFERRGHIVVVRTNINTLLQTAPVNIPFPAVLARANIMLASANLNTVKTLQTVTGNTDRQENLATVITIDVR